MKRSAILLMAFACAATFASASASAGPFRNGGGRNGGGFGGGGRPERMEPRQDMRPMPLQRPAQGGEPGGGRMSPAERQQLREQIREHGQAYRERDRVRQ